MPATMRGRHTVPAAVHGQVAAMPDGPPRGVPADLAGADFVERCRAPAALLDADHPAVVGLARAAVGSADTPRERAVRLYYAVRDRIRYDPFTCSRRRDDYRASAVAGTARNWCVPKAGLMAAAARALGIAAAVGLADVTNHLNTAKLRAALGGTDVFHDHGYAALWLGGRWVKVAPVFNRELCERFGVAATEFDGEHDALLQPYDAANRRHMEYLRDDGLYADLPFETVMDDFARCYPPGVFGGPSSAGGVRFEDDRPLA
jgi:transglutaminase-like putative cysteine protease